MITIVFLGMFLAVGGGLAWMILRTARLAHDQGELPMRLERMLDEKHQGMLRDLYLGLTGQGDRIGIAVDRLREQVARELGGTREAVIEKIHQVLADHGKAGQELIQSTLRAAMEQLGERVQQLTKTTDARLEQISGKVSERLDEGFKKTNETFANVMARLATIDEAQKKLDGLTTNVVSLQELLGDKRSRGAFGEVQLEALVRNILPPQAFAMQHTLSTGARVDCALFLPPPTGTVPVDSKFPLENFRRMVDPKASEVERERAAREFKADVKRHIDAIAEKYLVPDETSDGAVMFVPAEAVFAEIHGHHPELVAHALARRIWIVSPTTMMAVLNTARAVLKDVETRKQVHIIKDNLGRLAKEFERFDERMKKLADHIRLANKDADEVYKTSRKISSRFAEIEQVELEPAPEQELLGA